MECKHFEVLNVCTRASRSARYFIYFNRTIHFMMQTLREYTTCYMKITVQLCVSLKIHECVAHWTSDEFQIRKRKPMLVLDA